MRLLLDTHILLWWLTDGARIPQESREAIQEGKNQVFVSAASAWEISIKRSLGKLRAPTDLKNQVKSARFEVLSVTIDHALAVADLPAHHSDPFDRILVAQALVEDMMVVTVDPKIHRYDVAVFGRAGRPHPGSST